MTPRRPTWRTGRVRAAAAADAGPSAGDDPPAGPSGPTFAPPRRVERADTTVKFVRSSGPGGQNVNKVSTKADLRFNVIDADWMPEEVRIALLDAEANRVNAKGELVVQSDRTRTQK